MFHVSRQHNPILFPSTFYTLLINYALTISQYSISLFKILQFIFNTRDPIIVGVMVEAGIIKEGTPLCVPNAEVSFCFPLCSYLIRRQTIPELPAFGRVRLNF